LREDGTPDYAAWLEARYSAGVTAENNAALVLREIEPESMRRMGVDPKQAPEPARIVGGLGKLPALKQAVEARPELGPLPPDFDRAFVAQHTRALAAPWRTADAPLVAAWLAVNAGSLARIEEATHTRDRWFTPLPSLAFDARFPSLLDLRLVSNALRARALHALARGDRAGARRDVIGGLRLAALLEQGMWLIERLIAVAMRGIAAEAAIPLANPPRSPGEARALLDGLMSVPESSPLQDVLEVNERVVRLGAWMDLYRAARRSPAAWEQRMGEVLDTIAAMNAGLGADPPPAAFRRIPGWAVDWDELFSTLNRCWGDPGCSAERASAQADLRFTRLQALVVQARWQRAARRRIARAFLNLEEGGSLDRASVSWNEAEALRRLALVSAVAAVARTESGRYPADATALRGFEAEHAGYVFAYASDGRRFAASARPQRQNQTGVRGFCADSDGTLAYAPDGRPPLAEGTCDLGARVLAARTPTAATR
jgi:hypothetical protein